MICLAAMFSFTYCLYLSEFSRSCHVSVVTNAPFNAYPFNICFPEVWVKCLRSWSWLRIE
uniref:Secreted protein n=1 Tax=Ascaris lumbricoides TaxID=6252 RepID=A0A0M3IW12_ASCLU